MICLACGSYNEDGAMYCRNCGAVLPDGSTTQSGYQGSGENGASEQRLPEGTTVLSPDMLPYATNYNQSTSNQGTQNYNQSTSYQGTQNYNQSTSYQGTQNYNQSTSYQGAQNDNQVNFGNQNFVGGPAYRCATNRAWWKMLLLGLITFGIYDICIWCKMSSDINIVASRYDGKRTMHYFEMSYLAPFTLGIYMFVWFHQFSNRLGDELRRRGIGYYISAKDFWLWSILGSLILVGPFVYLHKVCKAVNLINEHYNING